MGLQKALASVFLATAAFGPFQNLMAAPALTRTQEAAYLPHDPVAGLTAYAAGHLTEVIKTAYGQGSQFVILGDTDHGSLKLAQVFYSPALIKAAAESGVTDIYIELPPSAQKFANSLLAGRMTNEDFANKMMEDMSFTNLSTKDAFEKLANVMAPALIRAATYNINVHFVDREEDTVKIAPADARELFRKRTNPIWQYYNRADFNIMAQSVEDGQTEINSLRRLSADKDLGHRIGEMAQGRKGLIIYGSAHGSYFNDLDEYLPGETIKIDVYEDLSFLKQFILDFQNSPTDPRHYFDNKADGDPDARREYEDKPELVFIMGDIQQGYGFVYQTVNTPPLLKDALAPMIFVPNDEGIKILHQAQKFWELPSQPRSWK